MNRRAAPRLERSCGSMASDWIRTVPATIIPFQDRIDPAFVPSVDFIHMCAGKTRLRKTPTASAFPVFSISIIRGVSSLRFIFDCMSRSTVSAGPILSIDIPIIYCEPRSSVDTLSPIPVKHTSKRSIILHSSKSNCCHVPNALNEMRFA